jgi:hypothetical protein
MLDSDLNEWAREALDLETTGLYPGGTDRVIEVAVLRVASGRPWLAIKVSGMD